MPADEGELVRADPSTATDPPTEAARFRAIEEAARDSAKMKVSCLFCGWNFTGTTAECRERTAAHRLKKHPEITAKRRPKTGSSLRVFRQVNMSDEDRLDIERERLRRARLHGVEIEE